MKDKIFKDTLSEEEFTKIVRLYERRLYAVALAILKDPHESMDIVQDAFIRLFRSYNRIKNPQSLNAWLLQTTRNLAIDHLRSLSRRKENISYSQFVDLQDVEHLYELVPKHYLSTLKERKILSKAISAVLDALSQLPDYYRESFLLRYMEDMSIEEIAKFLGVPNSTVEGRVFNARQLIRKQLEKLL
ncbi:MAG: RNA polymerase sigma factor [Planctomycetota bacterium]|nr:RNA polymerase sigma factor [Planctomycetota bacterium]